MNKPLYFVKYKLFYKPKLIIDFENLSKNLKNIKKFFIVLSDDNITEGNFTKKGIENFQNNFELIHNGRADEMEEDEGYMTSLMINLASCIKPAQLYFPDKNKHINVYKSVMDSACEQIEKTLQNTDDII